MDLKEFIKESLVQISKGITEANQELEGTGSLVNPSGIRSNPNPNETESYARIIDTKKVGNEIVHWISFDVALHAESNSESGGGLKLSIASFGASANGKSSDGEKSESRVQFEIPMKYPQAK